MTYAFFMQNTHCHNRFLCAFDLFSSDELTVIFELKFTHRFKLNEKIITFL